MTVTRDGFEAAFATIPQSTLQEQSWLWRVNSWEKVCKEGALQAAYLRRWSLYVDMRSLAPEFYDWLLEVFPASEDQRVLSEHVSRSKLFFGQT